MGSIPRPRERQLKCETILPVSGGRRIVGMLGAFMAVMLMMGALDVMVWKHNAERQIQRKQVKIQRIKLELKRARLDLDRRSLRMPASR